MKRISCFILMLCIFIGALVSCKTRDEEDQEPFTVDLSGYTVIRSEHADSKTVMATSAFLSDLKTKTGLNLDWDTDFLKAGKQPATEAKEILIGYTNRPESENLRYSDYSITFANSRIAISAGSGEAVEQALSYFLDHFVSERQAVIPAKGYNCLTDSYPMENVTLNGIPLGEFSVAGTGGTQGKRLRDWLGVRAGIRTESLTGHTIYLTASAALGVDEVAFSAREDGGFDLSYSSFMNMPELAVDWMIGKLTNGNGEQITMSSLEKVTIPDSAYADIPDVRNLASTAYFMADTDKDPLTYQVGDEVVFSVSLIADGKIVSCPKFTWTVETDNGKKYSGTEDGRAGRFVVKIPATATGTIRLKPLAKDNNGKLISNVKQSESAIEPAMFGACVNAAAITASVSEPSDFDAFWASEVAKLSGVAPNVISMEKFTPASNAVSYTEGSVSYANFDYYRVKIAAPTECGSVVGVLSIPKNTAKNSVGITVVFNGYGVGDLSPYIAANQIVLNVCAHSIELGREESYYTNLSKSGGALYNYCFKNNESRDTCYFRTMILRDLQAVRFMKQYAGTIGVSVGGQNQALGIWNGNLKLFGGSQGAFQGIAVASLDKDVTEAFWWIPWMCDVGGTTAGKIGSGFRPAYTEALRYFDTVFFARRIDTKVKVSMQIGLGDFICPPSGTIALYNALRCSVKCEFKQGMTHGYTPPKYSIFYHNK